MITERERSRAESEKSEGSSRESGSNQLQRLHRKRTPEALCARRLSKAFTMGLITCRLYSRTQVRILAFQ